MKSNDIGRVIRLLAPAAAAVALVGCETKSFVDPSEMGRYEKAPKVVPILDKLVVGVEGEEIQFPGAREVTDADLKINAQDYRVGSGDLIQVTVQDLSTTGLQSLESKRVSESGRISLPYLSQVPVAGLTESEIEAAIIKAYADAQILTSATVSVAVVESQNKLYTISGSANQTGPYPLLRSDFRLRDALATARGVTSELGIDYIYVIRRKGDAAGASSTTTAPTTNAPAADPLAPRTSLSVDRPLFMVAQQNGPLTADQARRQANDLANQLNRDAAADPLTPAAATAAAAPRPDSASTRPSPVTDATPFTGPGTNENPVGGTNASGGFAGFTAPSEPTDRETIRIPYPALRDGSLKYNIVIRPQDEIYVPSPGVGEYYMGGHVARPGVFSLTARKITLKQAIMSSGMLDQLAIPARTDVIRRTGANEEVFVRVDLERIFSGLEPDIYLKPNDQVMVGTNAGAPFLAALRNAFRITYGFGFLYDRNFDGNSGNNR